MLKSVRILSNSALEELKLTVGSLIDLKDSLETYEAEHESNLSRPMGAKNKPVQIPMTDEMIGRVDSMLDVAEKAILALEIAEFTTLENQSEVQNYALDIAEQFKNNHEAVDNEIQKYSNGWDISRLVKMDKDILRIAITELLFSKGAPVKVIVDEAVELAKKYSTEDSSSFVNGILAKVIVENGYSTEDFKELLETLKTALENDNCQKGFLSRFGDTLSKHAWLSSPIAQLLISHFFAK